MLKPTLLALGAAAMLSAPAYAADNASSPSSSNAAASSQDLEQIRQEMQALKQSYEQRLQNLEQRLQAAEAAGQQTATAAPAPEPVAAAQNGNAFNPKISLIMNGTYAHYSSNAPAVVPGYLLGDETGFTEPGMSLGETELAIEANIDDKFRLGCALCCSGRWHRR